MASACESALTVGEIARRRNVPVHKVEYIVRSRRIRPAYRAGNAFIFSESDAQFIASELRRIDESRGAAS